METKSNVIQAKDTENQQDSPTRGREDCTSEGASGQAVEGRKIENLKQYSDPDGNRAAVIERNRSNPPSLETGLRSSGYLSAIVNIRCDEKLCPGDWETCSLKAEGLATCPILPEVQSEFARHLTGFHWINADDNGPDAIIVSQLSGALARQWYIHRRLENVSGGLASGLCSKNSTAARLYQELKRIENRIDSLCNTLGLNPQARARLGVTLATGMSALEALEQAQQKWRSNDDNG